jgi:hypothetical protein
MRKMQYRAAMLLLLASTAFAAINPVSTRNVPIGSGDGMPLQSILDFLYPGLGIDADDDQQTSGAWQLPGAATRNTAPILQFEFAGNANSNSFGIWSGSDPNDLTLVEIFKGGAGPNTGATLKWVTGDTDTVHISADIANDPSVNAGSFNGINRYFFGFYLSGPGGTFYTVDSLNQTPGAQAVVYRDPVQNFWTFAFEDVALNAGADRDYNDMVVTAESIVPAPDGGVTVLLLGGALAGLEVLRRKFYI